MPLQNRVTPGGEILAAPWRGTLMGNRGRLHDDAGRLGAVRWRTWAWVCCLTEFRGRWREPMPPGRWTALFFTDEPSALAAGHRPCGECRRADYRAFRAAWAGAGLPGEDIRGIDRAMQAARVGPGRAQRRHLARFGALPDGVFTMPEPGLPVLKWRGGCLAWQDGGYRPVACPGDEAEVTVLTPAPTVAVLAAGYPVGPPALGAQPDPR